MKGNCIWVLSSLILIRLFGVASVSLGAEDTWTTKSPTPTARSLLSTSAVDGMIYAIGDRQGVGIASSAVEQYDPVTDTWTKKSPMPTARMLLATSVVNGKIYAIGGALAAGGNCLSTVEMYDPATDTWTTKAAMPTRRTAFLATSAVNGKIYAIGGTLGIGWTGISTVEEYNTGFVPDFITSVNPSGKFPTLWGEIKRSQ